MIRQAFLRSATRRINFVRCSIDNARSLNSFNRTKSPNKNTPLPLCPFLTGVSARADWLHGEHKLGKGTVLYRALASQRFCYSTRQASFDANKNTWKEVVNSQGRIYYQNIASGVRSWEKPSGISVNIIKHEQVKTECPEENETTSIPEARQGDGGSLIVRALDHFWSIASVAHTAYWVAAVGGFIYIGYELIIHYYS